MPNGLSLIRNFSLRRLRLRGSTLPTWGTQVVPYSPSNIDAHIAFLRNVLGVRDGYDRVTPASIVSRFDKDPSLIELTGHYIQKFMRDSLVTYPVFAQDPSAWSLSDRRTMITDKRTNSEGHYIYSGCFEPNTKRDFPQHFKAALHLIASFPAGGGFVIPKSLYLDAVAEGRALRRFPRELFAKNAELIGEYNRNLYEQNRSLAGEIVILGNNAVAIRNHEIFQVDGEPVQVMRPVTMSNHVFYNGQAIWVSAATKDFAHGTVHMYIGQGKSDVALRIALGDRLNTASGVPTFKDVFRAGVTTYEEFDTLLKDYPKKAASLALDPDVARAIDVMLARKDPALLWDRKLLTLLDNSVAADVARFFNPYTPTKCLKKAFFTEFALPEPLGGASPLGAGDPECDITDVDLDELIEKQGSAEMASVSDFMDALDGFPTGANVEQLVDAAGNPFELDMYSGGLSLTRAEADAVFTDGGLFGSALDDLIAREASKALGDEMDWKSVRDALSKEISRQVDSLVEATSAFADGSSVAAVVERFSTVEFQQSVRDALQKTLQDTLGPKSGNFPLLLEALPVFQSASDSVKNLLRDYPLVEALTNQVFTAMTTRTGGSSSYFQAEMSVAVVEAKRAYFSEPAQKSAAQKAITERIAELGDVANLEPDMAKTRLSLEKSMSDLEEVNQELLATPGKAELEDRRQSLEREVERQLAEQRELEDKQAQASELDAAQAETNDGTLESEGEEAKREGEHAGDPIFRPGGE